MIPFSSRPDQALALAASALVALCAFTAGVLIYPTLEPAAPVIIFPTPLATSTPIVIPAQGNEVRFTVYTTAYTWHDNTPPGSSLIAFARGDGYPTVHNLAGGVGTYSDPITLAVGHVITNDESTPDYKPGTRFYLPDLRRYFIVEDTCGDGDTPQNIPCHKDIDHPGVVQVDLWVDTSETNANIASACASSLTDTHLIIKNPLPNYAVVAGPLYHNGSCAQRFGDSIKTQ